MGICRAPMSLKSSCSRSCLCRLDDHALSGPSRLVLLLAGEASASAILQVCIAGMSQRFELTCSLVPWTLVPP